MLQRKNTPTITIIIIVSFLSCESSDDFVDDILLMVLLVSITCKDNMIYSQLVYAVANTQKMYDKNPLHKNDSIHMNYKNNVYKIENVNETANR